MLMVLSLPLLVSTEPIVYLILPTPIKTITAMHQSQVTEGKQQLYLDLNDGQTGFGVTTNEPTFDWHLENIRHYEWKRTLVSM